MTTRLPAEELLQVIRISQAERRAEARLRHLEPDPHVEARLPALSALRSARRPAREREGSWSTVPRA